MNSSPQTDRSPKAQQSGFTLVEVLVAALITSILILVLFQVTVGALDAWRNGTARLRSNADARVALDLFARDVEMMLLDGTSSTVNQQWIVSRPDVITNNAAFGEITNTWLMFFSPSIDRNSGQRGDISAISYRVAYQDIISTNTTGFEVFALYKTIVNTTNTYIHALATSNIVDNFWGSDLVLFRGSDFGPYNWTNNTANISGYNGETISTTNRADFLVPNVVDFSVAWTVRHAESNLYYRISSDLIMHKNNDIRVKAPAGVTFPTNFPHALDGGSNPIVDADGFNILDSNYVLDAAEVSMIIVDDEGISQIRLGRDPDAVLQTFGRQFTQRIRVAGF